jgi:hypothetical protein
MAGQTKFNLINICKILYCLPEAAMVCAILLQSRGLKKDDIVLLKILFLAVYHLFASEGDSSNFSLCPKG